MLYTYDTLFSSCQNYCIDNSSASTTQSYASEFPKIVQLGEMRIIKDLNLPVFDTQTSSGVTLTAGSQNLSKPSDFIAIQDFFVIVNGSRVYLQPRSKSYLDKYWPNYSNIAEPIYYADNTTDLWQLAPTPDQNYQYQVNYIARPLPMSATNQTTWIGDKLGELLLPACLTYSMGYFREDLASEQGTTAYWERVYQAAANQALTELSPSISAKDNITRPITTMGG